MRILFMGTPDFAVQSLSALVAAGHTVAGVVTREDAPKGRKMVLTPPPVKVAAQNLCIPVYQPHTLRDEGFAQLLREIAPELIVVVAYGKILPQSVLDFPPLGCINVHGSLLPDYRGAAPMQRALADGKKLTGITTMYMDAGMDTGDMLLFSTREIGENETLGELSAALSRDGAELLVKTLGELENGTLTRTKQDGALATSAPKFSPDEERADFTLTAKRLHDRIRALNPEPMCRAYTPANTLLKIASACVAPGNAGGAPCGTVISADRELLVACGENTVLQINSLIPEGKQKMNAADYLRGRKLSQGDTLRADKQVL